MKVRALIAVLLLAALLVSSVACPEGGEAPAVTPTPTPTPTRTPAATPTPEVGPGVFQINEWSVIDDDGTPKIAAQVTASDTYSFTLTGPKGMELDSGSCAMGTSNIKLKLAEEEVTAKGGGYTLLVSDLGREVATHTFEFEGAELSVGDISLDWETELGGLRLEGVEFKVANSGDLPAYLTEANMGLRGKELSLSLREAVLPDSEQLMSSGRTSLWPIARGHFALTLDLRDGSNTVVWSSFEAEPPSAEEMDFQINEWSVIEDDGAVAMHVLTDAKDNVHLTTVDPVGHERDWRLCDPGVNEFNMRLAGEYETPRGGEYTLVVEDAWGNEITSRTFDFDGPDLTVSTMSLDWSPYLGLCQLRGIEVCLRNNGDLPGCVEKIEIDIGGDEGSADRLNRVVMHDREKVISVRTLAAWVEVSKGDKTLTLTFKDSADRGIHTHSEAVNVACP